MKLSREKIFSILESALFCHVRPLGLSDLEKLFNGQLTRKQIQKIMEEFIYSLKEGSRGLFVEKVLNGYQLRTKPENKNYLLNLVEQKPFRLSRSAMEVLSVVAYRQPCIRQDIEEIRGVESSHLLKTLMEKGLVSFAGRSSFPGRPFLYKTTSRFLEVFGFNSLKDLPSEEEILALLPETAETGIGLLETAEGIAPDGKILIPQKEDERENLRLKSVLKSIPETVSFLNDPKTSNGNDNSGKSD